MKDCNNCKHEDCWEYAEPCSSCTNMTGGPTNWEPQSNYNSIISKTPEELAEFLQKNRGGCRALTTESYVCNFYTDDLNTDCKACWLDWLMQEAEERE